MKQILGIGLVAALGFLASQKWFGRVAGWTRSRFVYLTGEEFLLLGVCLGPLGFGLLDREGLRGLEPFIGFGMAYVGFVYGMQFEPGIWGKLAGREIGASATSSLIVAAVVAAAWHGVSPTPDAAVSLAVGAAAGGTSTAFLHLVDRHTRMGRVPLFRFLRVSSVLDDLWGIALYAGALIFLGPPGWKGILGVLAVVAAVCGTLRLVLPSTRDPAETMAVLVGAVLFVGGTAALVGFSPLAAGATTGLILPWACRDCRQYLNRLVVVEQPAYLLMLVLAGAWWVPAPVTAKATLALVGAYAISRGIGKAVGGVAAVTFLEGRPRWTRLGLGALAQSEVAVVVAVELLVIHGTPASRLGATALLAGVVVNDLLAAGFYNSAYGRRGP